MARWGNSKAGGQDGMVRIQSVPKLNEPALTISAVMIIIYHPLAMSNLAIFIGWRLMPVLLMLAGAIGGVLMLREDWRKKHYILALCLLLVGYSNVRQIAFIYIGYKGSSFVFGLLPILLMIISAIGIPWNQTIPSLPRRLRVPVLNLAAAALLAIGLIKNVFAIGFMLKWLLLIIVMPVALIMINLCLYSRRVVGKPNLPDVKGLQGARGFGGRFYNNVGGKLQMLAKIQGIICLVIAGLSAAAFVLGVAGYAIGEIFSAGAIIQVSRLALMIGAIGAPSGLLLAITTWPLYAYGQITADVRAIKDGGVSVSSAPIAAVTSPHDENPENPDELPEL